jgi:cobalt/nickel transport system permease protein
MHIPDGFINGAASAGFGVVAAGGVGAAVKHTGRYLSERQVPLAGLVAAFVFAAQMVNFPIASGTSGHLIGGALVAVLLGPWAATLVVAIVVGVQALVFADGGVTALGYNTLNMAIVTTFGGWTLFVLFRRLFPATTSGVVTATALASAGSVVLSAATFSLEWLFGASAPVPFDTVFAAMVGTHAIIGVGEAFISAAVVSSVLASRPDLVVGARDLDATALHRRAPTRMRTIIVSGILVALLVAGVGSQFAADSPDGLDRVAADNGIVGSGTHLLESGPFADYATAGIGNAAASLTVAGVAGVALTCLVGYGLLARPWRARETSLR